MVLKRLVKSQSIVNGLLLFYLFVLRLRLIISWILFYIKKRVRQKPYRRIVKLTYHFCIYTLVTFGHFEKLHKILIYSVLKEYKDFLIVLKLHKTGYIWQNFLVIQRIFYIGYKPEPKGSIT